MRRMGPSPVARGRMAGSLPRHAVAGEHGAHRVDELAFRHEALRLGLALQMLLAALFQFCQLRAEDQILDDDLRPGGAL